MIVDTAWLMLRKVDGMGFMIETVRGWHFDGLLRLLLDPRVHPHAPALPTAEELRASIGAWIRAADAGELAYLVARDGETVVAVGGARVKFLAPFGDFANIYFRVMPDYQRHGLGRRLAVAGIAAADACGLQALALVRATNTPAIGLVGALGMVRRARFRSKQAADQWVFGMQNEARHSVTGSRRCPGVP